MKNIFRAALAVLLPLTLLAHDTWLVPSAFRTAPGQTVRVRLATSEAFPTSEAAASPERIARFTLHTPAGTQSVTGYRVEGTFLVADVAPSVAGHAIVVAETKPRLLVLEAKQFNEYIGDEELQAVIAARSAQGKTNSAGRERYRKIAKTILCAGTANDSLYATPEGLWLEIIPERSTCGLRAGDALSVRVLFEGKPLSGARVAAGYEGVTGHKYPVWIPTGSDGRATVTFDRPGAWFVRTLHMIPVKDDAEADWHSAFSTLTFEVAPAAAAEQDVEAAIRAVLDEQVMAWNRGDLDGFMAGYWKSDRTVFAGSSGVFRGWQNLLDRYRRGYPDRQAMGRLEFSELEITVLAPDAAVVLGRWQLERAADRPGGLFTLVARKLPEGWRIIHDHTSAFPQ